MPDPFQVALDNSPVPVGKLACLFLQPMIQLVEPITYPPDLCHNFRLQVSFFLFHPSEHRFQPVGCSGKHLVVLRCAQQNLHALEVNVGEWLGWFVFIGGSRLHIDVIDEGGSGVGDTIEQLLLLEEMHAKCKLLNVVFRFFSTFRVEGAANEWLDGGAYNSARFANVVELVHVVDGDTLKQACRLVLGSDNERMKKRVGRGEYRSQSGFHAHCKWFWKNLTLSLRLPMLVIHCKP
ncbi:hypothetical protein POSPLADRAFT_1134762 [Postia placenta MAD-698-R-SB12]|uniref:Uncharacterized protein n=1 Tax=Postia placenta MAD-698-R-SB12 TaxID=670580 RepID=A0A1X6N8E4_9APHY|nr:hypothetical protein POSPLADRAFT_1134762 [Postia placenta MAD-698-R-SB12]OSX64726.1 hypothetical protein POSPLADRAFT_1134762 [Postia placenta MAD-698-R-SB12]